MIRFSNGREALVFAASGSLGFDGNGWWWERLLPRKYFDPSLFWTVTKTITRRPRAGNGWLKLRPIFQRGEHVGWVNALELPNLGFDLWMCGIHRMDFANRNIVVSLASIDGGIATREQDLSWMCRVLDIEVKHLAAIELNVSCPNTENGKLPSPDEVVRLCRAAKQKTAHPLIVKLSAAQEYIKIAKQLEAEKLVEAISINSVPWNMIFFESKSPFKKYGGGGVSGRAASLWTMNMTSRLARASAIPVIGTGVWDGQEAEVLLAVMGAKAVSFGSMFIATPWKPTPIARKLLEDPRWKK